MSLYIGLMSGTSMDGIDAALVDVSTHTLLYGMTKKYSPETQMRLNVLLKETNLSLASFCQLNTLIGREFAQAANDLLKETQFSASDICAIGSHGQTVCHNTQCDIPYTLQLGCGHSISSLTGITVVADFRNRDLVHGGQGAPFAPLYHQELFKNYLKVAVVNIGGIANISLIEANKPVMGWDVGPGNCLMDAWILEHLDKPYDESGLWASEGKVINSLLAQLRADPFIQQQAPKSIGKEYFSLTWLKSYLKEEFAPVDVQRTLLAFTAEAIAAALSSPKQDGVKELYLCGGGTHNKALQQEISTLLPQVSVQSIAETGVDPDYLEAMMFAWYAQQTIEHKTVDLRSVTGSQKTAILGAIYPI